MKPEHTTAVRDAQLLDLDNLLALENRCFSLDRLSRRSFKHLLRSKHSHCQLITSADGTLSGYILLLFRRGSSLARIYSVAVDPAARGQGLGRLLLQAAEESARQRACLFMRLEVRADNNTALQLYQQQGYRIFARVKGYYEDGETALRLEKSLQQQRLQTPTDSIYYAQTTPFTCGPAALMMAMRTLDPARCDLEHRTELQIWREATTIFMTAGHGGCSPEGLALSAWRRGFEVTLYLHSSTIPFIDSVRDPRKKEVIEVVHQDFMDTIAETDITYLQQAITPAELEQHIAEGAALVTLISTWRLNRNKAPHWVYIAASDDDFVYLNDPDIDDETPHPFPDNIGLPVHKEAFQQMACFGSTRLKATLVLKKRVLKTEC